MTPLPHILQFAERARAGDFDPTFPRKSTSVPPHIEETGVVEVVSPSPSSFHWLQSPPISGRSSAPLAWPGESRAVCLFFFFSLSPSKFPPAITPYRFRSQRNATVYSNKDPNSPIVIAKSLHIINPSHTAKARLFRFLLILCAFYYAVVYHCLAAAGLLLQP